MHTELHIHMVTNLLIFTFHEMENKYWQMCNTLYGVVNYSHLLYINTKKTRLRFINIQIPYIKFIGRDD
jgi:hypothetical protein